MKQNNISDNLNEWNKISRYSQWMYDSYKKYVGKRILDIGAGVGNMTKFYIDKAEMVVATDIFENQLDIMRQRFGSNNCFKAINFDIMNDDINDIKKNNFDTIILINVLEHLEDDYMAMQKLKDILSKNGHIIIIVPAFQKLYCYMDKNVSHYRRYDRNVLKKLAQKCGLKIIENKYFNLFGIIPYFIKGKFSKDEGGSFSTTLNENNSKLYNFASQILEPLEKILKPCIGISEIIILEKV